MKRTYKLGIAGASLIVLLVVAFAVLFVYEFVAGSATINGELEYTNELRIPPLLEPEEVDGTKIYNLTLQAGETEFFDGVMTRSWGANGTYLMPTIRAYEGDDIELRVRNELDRITTLHWHGMHLPPTMDGVHQVISPGETWQPYWQVRQQAATLWYHPHLHGETGLHVYNGLAGLFYLEDENSQSLDIPKEYGVNDFPIIVQDKQFAADGQFIYMNDGGEMTGDTLIVNGTYAPYLEVPTGLVRLRILNSSNARNYNFGFDDNREFFQIASDGGLLEQPVPRTRLLLGTGERAEILVNVSELDTFTLISYAADGWLLYEGTEFNVMELRAQNVPSGYTTVPNQLNTIERYDETQAANTRGFVLDDDTINGLALQIDRIDAVVHVGTQEIWEVSNDDDEFHVFHVHDVQFQILDRDGVEPELHEMGWKDSVIVDAGETVRLMMEFSDYADPHTPYMFHCHILEHEDNGMMGQFVVVADDSVTPEVRTELSELKLGQ